MTAVAGSLSPHAVAQSEYPAKTMRLVHGFTAGGISDGLKDFELVLYSGILAPRGVPRSVVDKLNAEFGKAVRSPEVQSVYSKVGALPVTNTPEEFSAHLQSEMAKLGRLMQLSGARVE